MIVKKDEKKKYKMCHSCDRAMTFIEYFAGNSKKVKRYWECPRCFATVDAKKNDMDTYELIEPVNIKREIKEVMLPKFGNKFYEIINDGDDMHRTYYNPVSGVLRTERVVHDPQEKDNLEHSINRFAILQK